jgi:limonene-1,2-epoxide hydrolase
LLGPSTTVDIKNLLADGDMVMVEGVDNFEVGGQTFALEIAAVSEVDDGLIRRWRD